MLQFIDLSIGNVGCKAINTIYYINLYVINTHKNHVVITNYHIISIYDTVLLPIPMIYTTIKYRLSQTRPQINGSVMATKSVLLFLYSLYEIIFSLYLLKWTKLVSSNVLCSIMKISFLNRKHLINQFCAHKKIL